MGILGLTWLILKIMVALVFAVVIVILSIDAFFGILRIAWGTLRLLVRNPKLHWPWSKPGAGPSGASA